MKPGAATMNESRQKQGLCVYCLRLGDPTTEFNREHIIPQSIGGNLFVDDMVCTDCNSELGRQVDCEILKVPDIINAMDQLGIDYGREGVIRSYYDTKLVSDASSFKARTASGEYTLVPQVLSDGSRVSPGHDRIESISKSLIRENRKSTSGLPEEKVISLLEDLDARLQAAPVDTPVACEELGLVVVNRTEVMKSEIKPKSEAAVERVVGKIALEWLFLLLGKAFVASADWAVDLRNLVCTGQKSQRVVVFRSQPPDTTIRMKHYLYVLILDSMTKVVFGPFGGIEYTMVAPALKGDIIRTMESETGVSGLVGIGYEQDLESPAKRFFALKSDGESVYLGEL